MNPENETKPKNPVRTRLESFLQDFKAANSARRPGIATAASEYGATVPARFLEVIDLLLGDLHSHEGAADLLSQITDAALTLPNAMLARPTRLPDRTDFTAIMERFGTEEQGLAELVLSRCFDQPTVAILDRKGSKEGLSIAMTRSVAIITTLTEALIGIENEYKAREVMQFWDEYFAAPVVEAVTISDFLNFASRVGPNELADQAHTAIAALGILSNYFAIVSSPITIKSAELMSLKIGLMQRVWEGEPDLTRTCKLEDQRTILMNIVSDFILDQNTPATVAVIPKIESPLGQAALAMFVYNVVNRIILSRAKLSSDTLTLPDGTKLLALGKNDLLTPGQFREYFGSQVVRNLNTRFEGMPQKPILTPAQFESLLQVLVPQVTDEESSSSVEALEGRLKGSLYAINETGYRVLFNLPEEQRLRAMGLSEIDLSYDNGKLRIDLPLGIWNFHFYLNHNASPVGLEKLSEKNRNWLLSLTYSYLATLKDGQSSDLKLYSRNKTAGDSEEFTEATESEKVHVLNRQVPHLRVLPIGQKPRKLDLEEREKMQTQFGVELTGLNDAFKRVQEDVTALRRLDPLTKELVKKGAHRIKPREEAPHWGQRLVITNPLVDYDPENDWYQFTYVRGVPSTEPLVFSCPGAVDSVPGIKQ